MTTEMACQVTGGPPLISVIASVGARPATTVPASAGTAVTPGNPADVNLIRSEDGGQTWSKGEPTEFKNPNSALDFIKLKNGHLLMVWNDNNEGERMPLTVAISTDNDKSWPHRRNIVNIPGDTTAYPVAIQTRDGKIHIVYTSGVRTIINHAVFDEAAILGHTDGIAE